MQVETRFYLSTNKVVNLKEWTRFLGLIPMRVGLKGLKASANPYAQTLDESFWTYGIKCQDESSVEAQLTCVIDQLYLRKTELKTLIIKERLEFSGELFIWNSDENCNSYKTPIHFSPDLLQKLAELEVPLTIVRY